LETQRFQYRTSDTASIKTDRSLMLNHDRRTSEMVDKPTQPE
jgi:hypothetical protein